MPNPPNLVFRSATVLDGTGAEPIVTDVAVTDDRISHIGQAPAGEEEINCEGYVLSPGFIDAHGHDDGAFIRHPDMTFKLSQGVTSVVNGNCGFSAIPASPDVDWRRASGGILAGLRGDFTDLEGYFRAALAEGPAINNMMLVGHNTVRSLVMGEAKTAPSAHELRLMREHILLAMEQGACGFSSGLIYRPGRYSDTEEVTTLASTVAEFGGLYTTHMRNEGDHLLEAVEEALTIGRDAAVHTHISHHKAAGEPNWGKVTESLSRIEQALADGQGVSLDVYPYTAGSGRMIEYFNLDRINEDLARVIRIASCPAFPTFEGRMLVDIASEEGRSLTELVHTILTAPRGDQTLCIQFLIDEQDIQTNLKWRDMMVGSDGIPNLKGKPHPRLYGTFPRVLSRYVRDQNILSLAEAVRRMTSLTAATFGISDRGQIKEGWFADLTLFDPERIHDEATYDAPQQLASGIHTVVVGGKVAFQLGQHRNARSGSMLRYRRDAYAPQR